MPRRVFFSFHFAGDFWRTQQVRNMNALEGQALAQPNEWEEIKRKGPTSIKKWIDDQLSGRSCLIALVGTQTATRDWVIYEIEKAWNDKKGVLGIRIDRLLGVDGKPSSAGQNPFERLNFGQTSRTLANVAPLKTPTGADSKAVYANIASNMNAWIEDAIKTRSSV